MSNRQRLARERLEYYLVYLILAYRHLILIVGLLLLAYAVTTISVNRIVGFAALLPAIFLLLLGNSYNAVVYTAALENGSRHCGEMTTDFGTSTSMEGKSQMSRPNP
jgi:hypothetical protein